LVIAVVPRAARDDDDDERQERLEFGKRAFEENCLICHADVLTQRQRLTALQWKTTVEKMLGWGAPVPHEQVQPLIEFLSAEYSTDKPRATPATIKPDEALAENRAPADVRLPDAKPDAGAAAYATHCATCHGADAQGADLGPNLVEHRILLRPDEYQQVLREGRRRMPGYRVVLKPADEANILGWLRTKRFKPAKP
jgi:mono/diheme cytochrome c family protein